MDFSISVFTLNCWGIPKISKDRKERFEALAKYLQRGQHSIVCLQEVWSENDYLFFKESLKGCLPYSHYFYSGVLGSGLCVFSKWLIQDVFFHQWPLNGYIHKVHHGDWFGGKGIGLCRIRCYQRLINVYCAHLHAEYHEDDMYLAHRMLQAQTTAEFVKLTASSADIAILAGDLNTAPGDLSYRIITQLSSLVDPLSVSHTNPMIRRASGTHANINNSYSDPKLCDTAPDGQRIDHIMFRTNNSWEVSVKSFGNPLEDRVPGKPFSYSDHNAVALDLLLTPAETRITPRSFSTDDMLDDSLSEAIKVCEEAVITVSKSRTLYLTSGGILLMFLIGTVGFWPNYVIYDLVKLVMTAFCFYCLLMGTMWSKIELNNLKAGLTAFENLNRTRFERRSHSSGDHDHCNF